MYKLNLSGLSMILIFVSAQLNGCGGTGQDTAAISDYRQYYRGLVIDGYLARTTVFLDTNNNSTRDPWEAWAFTDNQGYFSYNTKTETDYCASGASAEQKQYCLVTNSRYSNVVLRVDAGYDVTTGERFSGQMSRRIQTSGDTLLDNLIVSPITSLLTNVHSDAHRSMLLSMLELNDADLDEDYLDSNNENIALFNTAVKVHKVVTLLGDTLTDTYTLIGEEVGIPNDASSVIYSALATQIIGANVSLDTAIDIDDVLINTLEMAEVTLRAIYQRHAFNSPIDMTTADFERVVQLSQSIANIIDTLIEQHPISNDPALLHGVVRTIESLVIKASKEVGHDESLDRAIAFFASTDNAEFIAAMISTMGLETADVTSLSNSSFLLDEINSAEKIANAFSLPTTAQPFASLGNRKLRISDLNLGTAPDDLSDTEVEFYFDDDGDNRSGSFFGCIKYINGANINGNLGEGNTPGELINGFWSLLGAARDEASSYSLLLTMTFLGTTYQAIVKPAGIEDIDGTPYERVRFDNGGEIGYWHSQQGLTTLSELPANNEDCQARLPSRVGL